MYKFIKALFHKDPRISHVAYLYQNVNTGTYYLSRTDPESETVVDTSNQYMLLDNGPKITTPSLLQNIIIVSEVTPHHFMMQEVHNYKL